MSFPMLPLLELALLGKLSLLSIGDKKCFSQQTGLTNWPTVCELHFADADRRLRRQLRRWKKLLGENNSAFDGSLGERNRAIVHRVGTELGALS